MRPGACWGRIDIRALRLLAKEQDMVWVHSRWVELLCDAWEEREKR